MQKAFRDPVTRPKAAPPAFFSVLSRSSIKMELYLQAMALTLRDLALVGMVLRTVRPVARGHMATLLVHTAVRARRRASRSPLETRGKKDGTRAKRCGEHALPCTSTLLSAVKNGLTLVSSAMPTYLYFFISC